MAATRFLFPTEHTMKLKLHPFVIVKRFLNVAALLPIAAANRTAGGFACYSFSRSHRAGGRPGTIISGDALNKRESRHEVREY
jgi:hypothetical protein